MKSSPLQDGDHAGEELVVWDPTATRVYIYTPQALNASLRSKYDPRLMN
jgi:hypothetical protein